MTPAEMIPADQVKGLSTPARVSYLFMVATFVVVVWLNLATPLLAALFSYLALTLLHFRRVRSRWLTVVLFVFLVSAITYLLAHFLNLTVGALPRIADQAIPTVIQSAREYQIELPFTDYDSLKDLAFDTVRHQVNYLGNIAKLARGATTQFVFLAVGCAAAIGLFLNPRMELEREKHLIPNNLYSLCCDHIAGALRHALPQLRHGHGGPDSYLGR